jgi:hypothetical protein
VLKREKKTDKVRRFFINEGLRTEIEAYTAGMDDDDLLFPSRKGDKAISATQACRHVGSG